MANNPINSPFKDSVCPDPKPSGSWGGEKDGVPVYDGRKGTPGTIPQTVTVDVEGTPTGKVKTPNIPGS